MSQAIQFDEMPIEQIDLSRPELYASEDVLKIFKRLREEDPIHFSQDAAFGPMWSITRYEDCIAIDTDHKRFSSSDQFGGIQVDDSIVRPPVEGVEISAFITKDQPHHAPIRKSVQPIASPPALDSFKALIEQRTSDILDSLPEGEAFNWVDTVSIELTTQMLATLFNFPFEDRHLLTYWSDITTATEGSDHFPGADKRVEILLECLAYFTKLREARANGAPNFDLVSMMAHDPNTKDMDEMNFLGNLLLLIVGGNDTTRNSMTASVYGSSLFPAEWEKVKANRDLIPNTVAEIIRWQTPLAYMRRTALEDVEMHGKTIKKGDKVAMWYVAGNRDERKFENPNDLIFDRENARNHISFGFGIHRCFGNRLAELQLQILWDEMLKRFSKIEVVGEPERNVSSFVKGYTKMTVIARAK